MKSLRTSLLSALSVISLLAQPFSASAVDESHSPPAGETQQIKKEMDALRLRIDQLEKRQPALPGPRVAEDPGEKNRLLAETQEILARYRAGKSTAWKETHARIRDLRREVTTALETMQADYTRRTKLDEAVAIRDAIRCLAEIGREIQSDPGRLYNSGPTGEVLFFRVTGTDSGTLYGTGVYTSDSTLATAAVHAGILKTGQTGVVKVTTIPNHPQFIGSTHSGVTSSNWSSYPGYQVEALDDEDQDLAENEPSAGVGATRPPPAICDSPKPVPVGEAPIIPARKLHIATKDAAPAWPAALPAEAREQLEGHLAMVAELRQTTRKKVARLAAESVHQLTPIQDAHTRAARLDEAIAVRDLIRRLTP